MSKVSWEMYSKRRGVTLLSLFDKGNIRSYQSFVKFCQSLSIEPISETIYSQFLSTVRLPERNIKSSKKSTSDECCGGRHSGREHSSEKDTAVSELAAQAENRTTPVSPDDSAKKSSVRKKPKQPAPQASEPPEEER